ncbi:MAG: prolyl-tRNA synthetase associated domain-containing protein [Spirochaetes bacterium]|uniref:Prolyl-tRNA synthetase associated domain-containing protein n=1 Tax=Candidatus Ornithospirochaeta stercoripullorum TaxID=2840899 RepID=A0A9D9E1F9_9SPIO|nr:prolyl-tRNA synthetase associated domain-containing protein [Candidatus Ornithospirochaeta stercoripullorum]
MKRDDIIAILEQKDIEYESIKHKRVFSIAEMNDVSVKNSERIAKNLFLRDDKKRNYYLVSVRNDKSVDLKALRNAISSRPLSFASEDDLNAILSLGKGEVTPFGLLDDKEHKATYIIDDFFCDGIIGIHPDDNSETVFLHTEELLSLFRQYSITCLSIDVPEKA